MKPCVLAEAGTSGTTESPLACPHHLLNILSSQLCQSKLQPSSFYYEKVLSLLNLNKNEQVDQSVSSSEPSSLPQSSRNSKEPLSSAAKRRIRRKRNQMKRLEEILITTAAATAASILNSKSELSRPVERIAPQCSMQPKPTFNCNNSNNDHFYYNASSFKIKSCLRYVARQPFVCLLLLSA